MSVSPALEILQVTETQSEKVTALNTALSQFEQVVSKKYTVNTSSASSNGDIIELPYDNTGDLTDRTALRFIYLVLTAGASDNFKVVHPPKEHLFFVRNDSAYNATFEAGGSGVTLSPSSGQILYCDGNDFFALLSDARTVANDFDIQYWGQPGSSDVLADILVARDTTIPDNMVGAVGRVGSDPANTFVIDVEDDNSKFGEISISSSGNFSFTHTSSGARVISQGDRLRLVAPATIDPDIEDIQIAIPATAFV